MQVLVVTPIGVSKSIGLFLLVSLYSLGGLNHFLSANVYLRIMPKYLPFPRELIVISGLMEILLAALLLSRVTRMLTGWTIALMLRGRRDPPAAEARRGESLFSRRSS